MQDRVYLFTLFQCRQECHWTISVKKVRHTEKTSKFLFMLYFHFQQFYFFLYGIHLSAHLYFFGLIIRIFSHAYQFLLKIYCVLLYWYFILRFNHYVGHQLQIPDSTQSRDHDKDQINLPVTATPTIDTYLTVRPQIVCFNKIILMNLIVFLHILLIPFMLHRISIIH